MTTRETIEAAFRGDLEPEAARAAVDEALGLLAPQPERRLVAV